MNAIYRDDIHVTEQSVLVLTEECNAVNIFFSACAPVNNNTCNGTLKIYISDYIDKMLQIRIPDEVIRFKIKLTIHQALDMVFHSSSSILQDMLRYDELLFAHSVNVAIMSALLLETQEPELQREHKTRMVKAAFMHDIGKCSLDVEILNKNAKLTSEEYEYVKGHVLEGTKALDRINETDPIVYAAVAGHHSKINGYKCERCSDIVEREDALLLDLAIDIIAVSDVYDALKSRRHYKGPLPKEIVLEILNRVIGEDERMKRYKEALLRHTR